MAHINAYYNIPPTILPLAKLGVVVELTYNKYFVNLGSYSGWSLIRRGRATHTEGESLTKLVQTDWHGQLSSLVCMVEKMLVVDPWPNG